MSLRPAIRRENISNRQVEEDVYNGVREIPRMMMVQVNGERCVPAYAWLVEEGHAVPFNTRVISLSRNGQSVIWFEEGGEIPIIVPSAPNLAPLTPDNQPDEILFAQVNQPYPQMQPPIITRVNEPLLAQVNQPSPREQPPIIIRVNQCIPAVQQSVFSQVNIPSQMPPPIITRGNESLLAQVNQPSPQMQPPIITGVNQRFPAVQRSFFSQVNLPPQLQALLNSQIYQRHPNITQFNLASSQMRPPGPVSQRNEQWLLVQHRNTSQVNPPSPKIRPPGPVSQCNEQLPQVHHPNTSQVNLLSPQRPPGPVDQCNDQLQPLGISELNKPGPPLQGADFLEETCPYFQQAFLSLVVYLILGVGLYFKMLQLKHMYGCGVTSSIDPFYFLMVIMSSTGYGDQYPISDIAKLFTCLLILCGCGVVAGRFSALFKCLSSGFGNILFGYMAQRSGHPISERSRDKFKVWSAILVVIVCIVVGLVGGRLEGMGWIDSLYFSIVSVTSVGFGDKTFKSKQGKTFAIFWLPVSTTMVGTSFAYLAQCGYRRLM